MSFVAKRELKKSISIELVKSFNRWNEPVFFFVAIPFNKLDSFRNTLDKGHSLNLSDWGLVLSGGTGHQPHESDYTELEQTYFTSIGPIEDAEDNIKLRLSGFII